MATFAIRVPVYSNVTLKPKSGNFPQWILVKEEVIKRKKKEKETRNNCTIQKSLHS